MPPSTTSPPAGATPQRGPLDLKALLIKCRQMGYIIPDPTDIEFSKTHLTSEYHALGIYLFETGGTLEDFAFTIGMSLRTVRNWLRWGRQDPVRNGGCYGHFFQNYHKAKVNYRNGLRQKVIKYSDANQDWRGPMRLLESEQPEVYGKNKAELTELKAKITALTIENERLKNRPPEITPQLLAYLIARIPNKNDRVQLMLILSTAIKNADTQTTELPKKSAGVKSVGGAVS